MQKMDDIKIHRPESMPKSPLRILNEFRELKDYASESERFPVFNYDRDNMLKWTGLLVPQTEPYCDRAYEVEMELPHEYPRQPPQIKFRTKIFHPNVSTEGEVKLEQLTKKKWSQKMRMEEVIDALIDLIENPNTENHQLIANEECAELYIADNAAFQRKAQDFAKKNALKPPEPKIFRKPPKPMVVKTTDKSGKITKKVVINEKANQYSGPYIAVERLLKMTYDRSVLKKSSLKT